MDGSQFNGLHLVGYDSHRVNYPNSHKIIFYIGFFA